MNLRASLMAQGPSLELQRAAADEIARLDAVVRSLALLHYEAQAQLGNVRTALQGAVEFDIELDATETAPDGDSYNRLFGYVEGALNCINKENK
jgi:hypothetical protein